MKLGDRYDEWLHSLEVNFLRTVGTLQVPIVIGLAIASGCTTYAGLLVWQKWPIALVITFGVQSLIVRCGYDLPVVRFRAVPWRWLQLVFILIVSLTVSVSFTYLSFLHNLQNRPDQDALIASTRDLVGDVQAFEADYSRCKAAALEHEAFQQVGKEYDGDLKKRDYRALARLKPVLELAARNKTDYLNKLKPVDDELGGLEVDAQSWIDSGDIKNEYSAYRAFENHFTDVAKHADTVIGGLDPTAPVPAVPHLPIWRDLTPTPATEKIRAFAVACALDFATVVLSIMLRSVVRRRLPASAVRFLATYMDQFSSHLANGTLVYDLRKTAREEAEGYNDTARLKAAAILVRKGLLTQIGPYHVERTEDLDNVEAGELGGEPTDAPIALPPPTGITILYRRWPLRYFEPGASPGWARRLGVRAFEVPPAHVSHRVDLPLLMGHVKLSAMVTVDLVVSTEYVRRIYPLQIPAKPNARIVQALTEGLIETIVAKEAVSAQPGLDDVLQPEWLARLELGIAGRIEEILKKQHVTNSVNCRLSLSRDASAEPSDEQRVLSLRYHRGLRASRTPVDHNGSRPTQGRTIPTETKRQPKR